MHPLEIHLISFRNSWLIGLDLSKPSISWDLICHRSPFSRLIFYAISFLRCLLAAEKESLYPFDESWCKLLMCSFPSESHVILLNDLMLLVLLFNPRHGGLKLRSNICIRLFCFIFPTAVIIDLWVICRGNLIMISSFVSVIFLLQLFLSRVGSRCSFSHGQKLDTNLFAGFQRNWLVALHYCSSRIDKWDLIFLIVMFLFCHVNQCADL